MNTVLLNDVWKFLIGTNEVSVKKKTKSFSDTKRSRALQSKSSRLNLWEREGGEIFSPIGRWRQARVASQAPEQMDRAETKHFRRVVSTIPALGINDASPSAKRRRCVGAFNYLFDYLHGPLCYFSLQFTRAYVQCALLETNGGWWQWERNESSNSKFKVVNNMNEALVKYHSAWPDCFY